MAKIDVSDSNSILKNILIILVVAGIAYLIYYLYNTNMIENKKPVEINKTPELENYISEEDHKINSVRHKMEGKVSGLENPIMHKINTLPKGNVVGEENMEHFSADPNYEVERNLTSFPKEQLTAQELLPQDNSSLWAQVNPSGVGSLKDRSFLQAGYNIGINTVGQTLRNANLQLRSEPPCPQISVSPWLASTIEPDVSRKPFEIGGCA